MNRKISFHVTLLTLILTLLALTGSAIGITSYINSRSTVEDLSNQVLGHATMRIDQQVNQLLLAAVEHCELNRDLIQFRFDDYQRFALGWIESVKQHRWFNSVGFTQTNGNGWYVKREDDGSLSVIETIWDEKTHKLQLKIYQEKDYPKGQPKIEFFPEDARERPAYKSAIKNNKLSWTETYMMLNRKGEPNIPGLSCSTPVERNGNTIGVISVSFNLKQLCAFLKEIAIGDDGFPFLVELKEDSCNVIAHPDTAILLQKVDGHTQLVKAEYISDIRIRNFIKQINKHSISELHKISESEVAQIKFDYKDVPYRGSYRFLSTSQTPQWLICTIMPESSILWRVERNNRHTIFIVIGISAIAILLSFFVSLQVARPMQRLAEETEAIGQFRLAARPIPHYLVKEVDRLAIGMENMKGSLRSFQKYVPSDVVKSLVAAGKDAILGGEKKRVTIYFSDIADFTAISEQIEPERLVTQLGEYFTAQSEQIHLTNGTVDKYIGDAIMAFWGAPLDNTGHALGACIAALKNQKINKIMCSHWQKEYKPPFLTRIGLNTGWVVVGNIGSDKRMNYTVIGDPVNLASRLEGLNKYYDTEILISESTYQESKEGIIARPLDWVSVKGKNESILVYELLGMKNEIGWKEFVETYSSAIYLYKNREWERAIREFEKVIEIKDDKPSRMMIDRCKEYQKSPPLDSWNRTRKMDTK